MDAEPLAPTAAPSVRSSRPGAIECFQIGGATLAIIGAAATFIALGSGAGILDALRAGLIWGGAAGAGAWAALIILFVGADLGRSFEVSQIARLRAMELANAHALELKRLELAHAEALERAAAGQTVALAELEHSGRLREEHARHFALQAGSVTTAEPIADPMRALVQRMLLCAYAPSAWDTDGSGRLVDGVISRDVVMAAGYTKDQYRELKTTFEDSGVLTYERGRWRLDRVRYPTPQDGYRAIFGAEW
jgi:hypothetical protein